MPSYIVKVSRESDQYVWWSDIVEAPIALGTRREVQAAMAVSVRWAEDAADERFERADRTGCSAMWPTPENPIYAFDDHGPIAEQRGIVPRHLLGEYARLRLADDPAAFDLLTPLDDDEGSADRGTEEGGER